MGAAFYPNPVIVRMSDFKTVECACRRSTRGAVRRKASLYSHPVHPRADRNLLGGDRYEPEEANPMLGFRGGAYFPLDFSFVTLFRSVTVPFTVLRSLVLAGMRGNEDGARKECALLTLLQDRDMCLTLPQWA